MPRSRRAVRAVASEEEFDHHVVTAFATEVQEQRRLTHGSMSSHRIGWTRQVHQRFVRFETPRVSLASVRFRRENVHRISRYWNAI